MEKLKVLIVDDDVMKRKEISEMVENTGMASVVKASGNAYLAMEWLGHNEVQVILLDAVITGESSLEILKTIKDQHNSIEVILISDGTPQSAEITLEGLKNGALDFVKIVPGADTRHEGLKNQLIILFSQITIKMNTLKSASHDRPESGRGLINSAERNNQETVEKIRQFDPLRWTRADLVLIAASTGGPNALEVVCSMFPADFNTAILIVQHIPPEFTGAMVESLGRKCLIPITEGQDGDVISPHHIYIAPGGVHMVVEQAKYQKKTIRLINTPHVNGVRPSADVLFKSLASAYEGSNVLAVVLTGMGNDGRAGIAELKKRCNCFCIAQSEETCVVYGMPRSVNEAGLADEVIDLKEITPRICKIAAGRSW
ncbi:MAG: chemotaxis-specific protein-glutamate methyltransferase CheB [Syntrophomonadaceae bacterium]|nr:chemotaxis-specific protein-glutamate methyltransferase CheB [Syntrophomonadaceae bacterium]